MHTDGIHIWNCVANEGATAQMILHDGMGLNWQGYYTTGLVDYYGCSGPMYSKWLPFSTKITKNLKRSKIFNHLTVIAEWKN